MRSPALRMFSTLLASFVASILLCGCGGGPAIPNSLKGKVTYDGQSLPTTVMFTNAQDVKDTVAAVTGEDGSYETPISKLGDWKVSVQQPTPSSDPKIKRPVVNLPPKYLSPSSSGLSVTVKGGPQVFDVPLSKK